MPNKLIKQGYKIFVFVENGYVWHFQMFLRKHKIRELQKVDEFTLTRSIILQIARLLFKFSDSLYVIYLDNYFTSIPLFLILRKENIGATGTIRSLGIDFPALLIVLRKNWLTKLDWGITIAEIIDNVFCIGWQDNNFILKLSIVYTIYEALSWVELERNRLSNYYSSNLRAHGVCDYGTLPVM